MLSRKSDQRGDPQSRVERAEDTKSYFERWESGPSALDLNPKSCVDWDLLFELHSLFLLSSTLY